MRQFGIVILGASVYDNHPELNNPRFARSAKEFQKIWTDRTIIGDGVSKVLNLYDRRLSPSSVTDRIIEFLKTKFDDVVIYYCGHGVIPLGRRAYSVYLRGTKLVTQDMTALAFRDFVNVLDRFLIGRRVFFVIDACYSGEAIRELMDPNAAASLIDRHLVESLPRSGRAIITASEPSNPARALTEDQLTLFTGSLIETLRLGIADRGEAATLSWLEVHDQVVATIRERLGNEAQTPRILASQATDGDITKMPFFINRAFSPGKVRPSSVSVDDRTIEYSYWTYIANRKELEIFEEFVNRFPNGVYTSLAIARMKELIAAETDPFALEKFIRGH